LLKTRIWIDFSSPEKTNENWERLVRAVYGKPIYENPGSRPAYIDAHQEDLPAQPLGKYKVLRQAVLEGKRHFQRIGATFKSVY
jgi:hypothetical protein